MRVYQRVIACVEGFLLACPLLAFGRAIDKYRLACTLWIHKPTPIFSCHGHFARLVLMVRERRESIFLII